MSDGSKIEWTEATWNPVTGCTKVSPGCDHCYAERIVERFKGKGAFDVVQRSEEKLYAPLRWRRPRRVFVNSMSDLFHDDVPQSFIARVFSVMARSPQHTYQVLTKRHGRMRSLLNTGAFVEQVRRAAAMDDPQFDDPAGWWPLPNLWLGVSVEDQKRADLRIPALLDTPVHEDAARWLSCEPLLGPIELRVHRSNGDPVRPEANPAVDWVVVGGESGPHARPMHPDWARSLLYQCQSMDVPFFFKQWGEWAPIGPLYDQNEEGDSDDAHWDAVDVEVIERRRVVELERTGHIADGYQPTDPRTWLMGRLGKKAAGRVLDGRTWDAYPHGEVAPR